MQGPRGPQIGELGRSCARTSSVCSWLFRGAEGSGLFVWSPIAELLPHGCLVNMEILAVSLLVEANVA